jgi:hypothetical protein
MVMRVVLAAVMAAGLAGCATPQATQAPQAAGSSLPELTPDIVRQATTSAMADCFRREARQIDRADSNPEFVAAEVQFRCRNFIRSHRFAYFGNNILPAGMDQMIDARVAQLALAAVMAERRRQQLQAPAQRPPAQRLPAPMSI